LKSFQLFWEHSPLWLLPVLLLSALLAWWQYAGNQEFSKKLSLLLAGIRAAVYFIAGVLLLNPLLRYFRENQLPPVSVILIDDSRSVKLATKTDSLNLFIKNLSLLKEKLQAEGSLVYTEGLQAPLADKVQPDFRGEKTNLDAAMNRIRTAFEGQNLAQVILASDGIINQGSDLQDAAFSFKVNTIGLGNVSAAKDLRIAGISHNKVVYLGNEFPVLADVRASGISAGQVNVRLLEDGRLAAVKTISISSSGLGKAAFSLKALKKGVHEYQLELDSFPGEITFENNKRKFFIETVSEKQKVLILAATPHPDLKAIRAALEPLEQIEVKTIISGLDEFRPDSYNLVILHQLPDKNGSFSSQVSGYLKNPNTALLLIATSFTDFGRLRNEAGSWLEIQGNSAQAEEAGNQFDPSFQRFQFEESYRQTLQQMPPVKSPGASFRWKGSSETILSQLIGRVASPTPLLSLQSGRDNRRAVFWGDGFWLWRLNEFARNENTAACDNLLQKTCLLLLQSARRKQLQINTSADEYSETDVPAFFISTFNQLQEPVFDKTVRLTITGKNTKSMEFSMITSPGNPALKTRTFPSGAYHFSAVTSIDGREIREEGDFVVRTRDMEARQLEASHGLLKGLAVKNKGQFYGIASMMSMADSGKLPAPLVEFTDWNENLLDQKWILILLLLLLSVEWLLRKMNGSL
jgi:hypothetical protein